MVSIYSMSIDLLQAMKLMLIWLFWNFVNKLLSAWFINVVPTHQLQPLDISYYKPIKTYVRRSE